MNPKAICDAYRVFFSLSIQTPESPDSQTIVRSAVNTLLAEKMGLI